MQKMAKSGKMQKRDFTVFVAESENTVFFRFLGKMVFSRKRGIFRKGHFWGILGGGQK